jgi:hypothetical protein
VNGSITLPELIRHTRTCVNRTPGTEVQQTVERYSSCFEAVLPQDNAVGLNVFVFHVDVPASHRAIEYVDVKHDHWEFDYQAISSHFLWATLRFNQRVRIFFVTDEATPAPAFHPDVLVVRLPTDPKAPMLERVKAMAGYVRSSAFRADTVFLDTDAYPNRALSGVFRKQFDIGVTYRTTPGYMPINEGVIFCSQRNPAAVRQFFDTYLGTYERLLTDARVVSYYGNIERWRGGQLSLNAVALPTNDDLKIDSFDSAGVQIAMFPCNKFNYWVTKCIEPGRKTWDGKFVLHLKGDSKQLLSHVAAYQQSRPMTSVTSQRDRRVERADYC